MASEYYIKERRYNGTDYDILYPTVTPTDGMVKTADGKSAVAQAGVDYQAPLTAGDNITIQNNVISAGDGLLPRVIVTAPVGSTVTAVKDGEIVVAIEESGTWLLDLPSLGVWTVNAIRGTKSTSSEIVVDVAKVYTLELFYQSIYGVHWDGTASTALTRTDDSALFPEPNPYYVGNSNPSSPFDNLYPWSGMMRSNDPEAGELVSIPKFWFKLNIASDNSMDIKIANYPADGFSVSPAHMDRGDGKGERDVVYIGRYHCNNSNYKSTSNYPKQYMSRPSFRTNIHNLGSTIWQNDIHTRITIWLLYIVEFADWNSQIKIGYGSSTSGSIMTMGYTDSMPYHTGTIASSRTEYGGAQYRYIEGLWDNVYDFVDGIYFSNVSVYIINNPSSFSDTSNGTNVLNRPITSHFFTSWQKGTGNYGWFIYPNTTGGGSNTSYIPDYCTYSYDGVVLRCGGSSLQSLNNGLFWLDGSYTAQNNGSNTGSRLMKLP